MKLFYVSRETKFVVRFGQRFHVKRFLGDLSEEGDVSLLFSSQGVRFCTRVRKSNFFNFIERFQKFYRKFGPFHGHNDSMRAEIGARETKE